MNCWECEEWIARALRDRSGLDEVGDHLAGCRACRAFAEQFGQVAPILEQVRSPVPRQPAPAPMRDALVDALADAQQRQLRKTKPGGIRDSWSQPLRILVPAVGAAILCLAFVTLSLHEADQSKKPQPPVGATAQAPLPQPTMRATPGSSRQPEGAERHPATALIRVRHSAQVAPSVSRQRGEMIVPPGTERVLRAVAVKDDFVQIPLPRLVDAQGGTMADAVKSYEREAAIVDGRLAHRVTLAEKGTALSDVCERLRANSGIRLTAGSSVADEKVTLFCEKAPLRDVMRHLSRPFGYAWLRSGKANDFRYELVQDLKSQLIEEELRNRDRNEALLALEREIERFRPYLNLSPDEALARAKNAPPAEKKLLETLAGHSWGAIQVYVRLSAQDLAALRAGQELNFSALPESGERPLPAEVARAALQSFRNWYVVKGDQGYRFPVEKEYPGAVPVPAVPEARPRIRLVIVQTEPGRSTLRSFVGWRIPNPGQRPTGASNLNQAVSGQNPTIFRTENATTNAGLARGPAFRRRVTLRPEPSYRPATDPSAGSERAPEPKVTTADVLEALQRATGMPIAADYYTRLYKPADVTVQNLPLFDALGRLGDAMRMRWRLEGGWLQFRSTSYYHDRLKEVPNRLLARWTAARRRQGTLSLDDLCEIAALPDAQLDGQEMVEGAREMLGLAEWDLVHNGRLRPILRFLSGFSPEQRRKTMSATGLPFTEMTLAQQQQFLTYALQPLDGPLHSLNELEGATLRAEYSHPGAFQWGEPGRGTYLRWVVPLSPGAQGRRTVRPPIRERTREAVVRAIRQVDPQIREALSEWKRRDDIRLEASPSLVEEAEIFPTVLDLTFAFIPGSSNARPIRVTTAQHNMISNRQ